MLVARFRFICAQSYTIDSPQAPGAGEWCETYGEAFEQLEAISEDYEEVFLWGRVVKRYFPINKDPLQQEAEVEETANAGV